MERSTTLTTRRGVTTVTPVPISSTTPKRCEEMQAVTKEATEKIVVEPVDLKRTEKYEFQPTSVKGVSFPETQRRPTISVNFDSPAEVQSIILPRDRTPNGNVQQFEVNFFSPEGEQINGLPIVSSLSPRNNRTIPARLDSDKIPSQTPVSRVEITIIKTTDDQSPKGVVLDIKACTEMTTSKLCA